MLRRLRALVGGSAPLEAQLTDIKRRLDRMEGQLAVVEKIWQRTRHLEPAVQAILRELHVEADALPYPERLTARRFRLASQNQEDGLTLALLQDVGPTSCRYVEIGSGLSGGNSAFLARELGWSGLMVDGNAPMDQVGRRFPRVTAVSAWVTRDNINDLIANNGFSGEVDVFSLDLDGNDYWIWEAMTACTPRIAILEYNSAFGPDKAVTVPYDAKFQMGAHPTAFFGASLRALTRLSGRKGYRLVAVEPTGVNAFFVRNDLAPHIPACDAGVNFRMLEKHDILLAKGGDPFEYSRTSGNALVEIGEDGRIRQS